MTSTCGCCSAPSPATPLLVYNRPSLAAILYRIGTFSSFREAMIESIPGVSFDLNGITIRPLVNWTSRDNADMGIAVIDMWSYLADVLTFYQERTANEAFLRTAILRESVTRLAALLGYEPAPGLAAVALLAFTLEKDKQLLIPVGLRVQSVPGQNEKPQKFETVEAVSVDAVFNNVRVFPAPQTQTPFSNLSTQGVLLSTLAMKPPLAPGQNLVIFDMAAEDKTVQSTQTADGLTTLTWSPAVGTGLSNGQMYRWTRKMRLFGANAPGTYLVGTPSSASTFELTWSIAHTVFNVSGAKLNLDASYDDLKKGQQLLILTPAPKLATITAATRATVSVGDPAAPQPALTGTVTQVTIDTSLSTTDLRQVVIYLLDSPAIQFESNFFPSTIGPNASTIYLQSGSAVAAKGQLVPKRTIVVDDVAAQPQSVTITAATLLNNGLLAITFTPALTRTLGSASAFLYGNVAKSTHGETVVAEVLGNGDAGTSFQSLALAKSPVTFTPKAGAPHGAANSLELRVDGILWNEVPNLYGHGPKERIYETARTDAEIMSVEAGDGQTGAPFSTGRANVVARYRVGIGTVGNLKAGVLKNPLDRPVGLKGVLNPLPAAGGADPESLSQARSKAPTTVRTFGRIVSLRDFEDAALDYPSVTKARATFTWDDEDQVVLLTVAGAGNTIIQGEVYQNLVADLNSRRDPNRKLVVSPHVKVPVVVTAAIQVDTPNYVREDVQVAVTQALLDRFAFDNVDLGQAIHISDIYAVIQNVAGVVGADVDELQFKKLTDRSTHGAGSDPRQLALAIFGSEIPFVEDAVNDITVTLGLE